MIDSEWESLRRNLCRTAYNFYGLSREDAEDLAQDIICRHLTDARVEHYPQYYWQTLVRNLIVDHYRAAQRKEKYFPAVIRATVRQMTLPDPFESAYLRYVLSYPEARTLLAINIGRRGRRRLTAAERVVQFRLRRRLRAKVGG